MVHTLQYGFLHVKFSAYIVSCYTSNVTWFKALCAGGGNVTFVMVIYSLAGSLIPVRLWVFTYVTSVVIATHAG